MNNKNTNPSHKQKESTTQKTKTQSQMIGQRRDDKSQKYPQNTTATYGVLRPARGFEAAVMRALKKTKAMIKGLVRFLCEWK